MFLADEIQINDVSSFCCDRNGVLSIDTTFNLCESWLTDTCYHNIRLETAEGKHPIFLGPAIIHFQKDSFIFRRFASEMITYHPNIQKLKVIGTDQEMAIYKGFASQIPELRLLLCVFHLENTDKRKIMQLGPRKGALSKIIADIYGRQYGTVKEYGLADSTNEQDLDARLKELKERWEELCPGFYQWFYKNRKSVFENSVIESARGNTTVQGLFYNNTIESMHFREKKEQCFKKGNVKDVISTLQSIVKRQENDEVRALYGCGPYRLSTTHKKFQMNSINCSIKWHSMEAKKRMKHVADFRQHSPTLDEHFSKPSKSGRKPNESKRTRKPQPTVFIDRISRANDHTRIDNPNAEREVKYELFFRSMVPRLVQRCQGNCGVNLFPADQKDYLLVRSYGLSTYTVKGETRSKYGPQYVHFNSECLKEYSHQKHDVAYEKFPLSLLTVNDATRERLSDDEKAYLEGFDIIIEG